MTQHKQAIMKRFPDQEAADAFIAKTEGYAQEWAEGDPDGVVAEGMIIAALGDHAHGRLDTEVESTLEDWIKERFNCPRV